MQRPITPSRWVWLALGMVCLSLLAYRPSRSPYEPEASDRPILPSAPVLPAQPDFTADAPLSSSPPPNSTDATTTLLTEIDAGLEHLVRATLGDDASHYAVVVKELREGTGAAINAGQIFYAASLFKLPVMYEAFRQDTTGELSLSDELTVTEAAVAEDLGTLDLWAFTTGDRVSVDELVEIMVAASDNTASVLLRDALGRQAIDRSMQSLGLRATSVSSPDLPTSAADMALLLEAVATGRGVSTTARTAMLRLLQQQWVRERIPAGLPPEVPVGNKTGSWDNAAHDVAIVDAPFGAYLLVVLSDLPGDDETIAALSRQVYSYYTDRARAP